MESDEQGANCEVQIWDFPTRLFHWLTASLVLAAYVTWRLDLMDWHAMAGEASLTLVVFRLFWGFFGSDTTRFACFLRSPPVAVHHLARTFRREPDRAAGHNPAGGWMVLLLLGPLAGETLSGLYVANDVADQGPLTELTPAPVANAITALHWIFWDALLAAIALHLAAIAVYALIKGHDLLTPMITGRKRLPPSVPTPRMASAFRASLLLGASALAVAALATML
jgi:cytochrome b